MDYEKLYKETIGKLRKLHNDWSSTQNRAAKEIESVFPELRESEGERIKNEIIAFVEQSIHRGGGTPIPQEQEDKWIAWLENKGERNLSDKVEPKFKVGDWVVDKHYSKTYQVFSIDNSEHNYIAYSCKPLFNTNDDWPRFHEDMIQPWTIQDANDGDVLQLQHEGIEHVIVYKRLVKKNFHTILSVHCAYDGSTNDFFEDTDSYHCITSECDEKEIHPATKEQRELLFSKMKEAGYEWDAEKKELKKIEQKHVDKIETRLKVGEWIINNDKRIPVLRQILEIEKYGYLTSTGYISFDKVKTDYHLWTIQDAKDGDVLTTDLVHFMFKSNDSDDTYMYCYYSVISDVFNVSDTAIVNSEYVHPATKEQRDLLFQKMKEAGYEWNAEKKELKKIEQASTWSAEDKKYIAHIIAILEGWDREHVSLIPSVIPKCIDWLKSLKPNIH